MAFMNWDEKYSVGCAMDVEHKTWFGILNRLHDAMQGGKGSAMQSAVLAEMVAYTRTHFAHEEALLQMRRYPDLAQHAQLHATFTRKVQALEAKLAGGGAALTIEMMDFLRDWLASHILAEDTKYGAWLRTN